MTSKWHETRKARLDELFTGKHYTIIREIKSDKSLVTPLGYKVKSGYELQDQEGNTIVVGKSLLTLLADEYNAVEKPVSKRRGRPRKKPLDQAEEWASRKIPNDAQQLTQPGPVYNNPNEDEHLEG